MQHLIFTVR